MSREVTLLGYVVVAVCALVIELAARAGRGVPTFGEAVNAALRRRPLRLVLLAGWLWVGWHVFVRVDWR